MGKYNLDKFINLKDSCKIIYGKNGAVLYDFQVSNQYDILEIQSQILKEIEEGRLLSNIYSRYDHKIVDEFIDSILETGVGELTNKYSPKEPYRVGNIILSDLRKQYSLNRVYIELPSACDKDCEFCDLPKINGCYTCKKSKDTNNRDIKYYYNLIDSILSYDCKNVIFHGGNPLLDWSFTKMILDYILSIKKKNVNIFLINADEKIENDKLGYLVKNKINVILNVNYSTKITLEKMNDIIYYYMRKKLLFTINFIVNYNIIDTFKNLYYTLAFEYNNCTYCLYSLDGLQKINNVYDIPCIQINEDIFNLLDSCHPCLFGTLSIRSNKKVNPCIEFDNNELIDLNDSSFDELFFNSNKLLEFWNMTFNDKENCAICKYRKTCNDCIAYDMKLQNSKLNKKVFCNII